MAQTYRKNKRKHTNIIYAVITAVVICSVFLGVVTAFYHNAENEAYEMLHIQTKQIKDDIILQVKSDRENLATMANFAAKLYSRGEDYSLMFDSFKPIGLFSRIGILTPECIFITKDEVVDLSDRMSFLEEAEKGEYVTGRTFSYSRPDEMVVRCAAPIVVNKKTVGIMYGIVKIEEANNKYRNMANELDAKLFVYDKDTGKFIIDSADTVPGELSELKSRKYNDGYTYEELLTNENGFSSFKSIHGNEDLYVHYSTIEDFNWGIILARYESQVFATTHKITKNLTGAFLIIILIICLYLYITIREERKNTKIASEASNTRKLLLEVNKTHKNIDEALKRIKVFLRSSTSFFIDTDGMDYNDGFTDSDAFVLTGKDRKYIIAELFKYAARIKQSDSSIIDYMSIVPDDHLEQTNSRLYSFLKEYGIKQISFVVISDEFNHTCILGVTNPQKKSEVKDILEEIAVCFSIAVYNNNNLNNTELVATTDSLTGVFNRVAYKSDILKIDEDRPENFTCIYIDVNELHLMNNKYGHAAGDEMLIYIANSLKEVFFRHRVYRMGGDEFLVFVQGVEQESIREKLEIFLNQLKQRNYHVAIGVSHRTKISDCEEIVREAEVRMYEEKSRYYQNKEKNNALEKDSSSYDQIKTGIREIDTMISVLKDHYNGIYRVSLDTDNVHRVLMPAYLGYNEQEKNFSKLFTKYIDETVDPDFRRALLSFKNYDAIKREIMDGKTPTVTFKKLSGEKVILSIYNLNDENDAVRETLWVFSKD